MTFYRFLYQCIFLYFFPFILALTLVELILSFSIDHQGIKLTLNYSFLCICLVFALLQKSDSCRMSTLRPATLCSKSPLLSATAHPPFPALSHTAGRVRHTYETVQRQQETKSAFRHANSHSNSNFCTELVVNLWKVQLHNNVSFCVIKQVLKW